MSHRQKILFVQKNGEGEYETEGLWCKKSGDNYIIDNIPFVAKRVSLGDIITVEYDSDEKAFYFDNFVRVSGNTTVRLHFSNKDIIEMIRNMLNELGCESEVFLERKILAVNIPGNVDYKPIKKYLDDGKTKGSWQYEESCLAHR